MIDPELLKILVCPEDRTPLSVADSPLLEKLNRAIADGKVRNRLGKVLDQPLQAGLVRQDGKLLYPVIDEIPVLLVDEAISLEGVVLASEGDTE
jgi:uncharacterized protein YbaR (Trm112 family)